MNKTIRKMYDEGLFDKLVDQLMNDNLTKDEFTIMLDRICESDEDFEDVFLKESHQYCVNILWDEIWWTACQKQKEQQVINHETVEDLLKKIIDLLSK